MINIQKAAIIGCGFVGTSIAFSLVQKGIFSELVLIDANEKKAEGEAMDLSMVCRLRSLWKSRPEAMRISRIVP